MIDPSERRRRLPNSQLRPICVFFTRILTALHVGLLKLEMPANVVQDSDGANQSDMIHNPTLPGLCLIRHKPESLPPSIFAESPAQLTPIRMDDDEFDY